MMSLEAARRATDTNPSVAKIQAGNYAKGELRLHGLRIKLESPRGSIRRSKPGTTPAWERRMAHDYGYVCGYEGADGDEVDVFIGPHPESELVVIVDQAHADGSFDEHKACLGFRSVAEATAGYLAHYPKGWKLGPTTALTIEQFKAWLRSGKMSKPVNRRVVVLIKAQRSAPCASRLGRAILAIRSGLPYSMTKADVKAPGSRGGRFYRTDAGGVVYGTRKPPQARAHKVTTKIVRPEELQAVVDEAEGMAHGELGKFGARRLAILAHPHVSKVWDEYQRQNNPRQAPYKLERQGSEWVLYRDVTPEHLGYSRQFDKGWEARTKEFRDATVRRWPVADGSSDAWNATWRNAYGSRIAEILSNALHTSFESHSDDLDRLARYGWSPVHSEVVPGGLKLGSVYERASGEHVEIVGGQNGEVLVRPVGKPRATPDRVSLGAFTSGRLAMIKAAGEGAIAHGGKARLGVDARGRKHWRTDEQPGDQRPGDSDGDPFTKLGITTSNETAEKSGKTYVGFSGETYAQLAKFRALKEQGLVWGFRKAGQFMWACKPENLSTVTEAFGGTAAKQSAADAKPTDQPAETSAEAKPGSAEPRSGRRGDGRGGAQPERGGDGRVPEGAKAGGHGKAADDRRSEGGGDRAERGSWSVGDDVAALSDKQVLEIASDDEEGQADTFIVRRGLQVTDENRAQLLAEFGRWRDAISKRKPAAEQSAAKARAIENARVSAAVEKAQKRADELNRAIADGKMVTVSVRHRHMVIDREAAAKFSGPMFKVTSRGQLAVQFGGKQGYGVLPEGGGAEITIDDSAAPRGDGAKSMTKAGPLRRMRWWLSSLFGAPVVPTLESTPKPTAPRLVLLVRAPAARTATEGAAQ